MDQGLTKLSQRASGLAEILQIAKGAVVKTTDSEIVYEPGLEMTTQVTATTAIDPDTVPGMQISFQPIFSEEGLQQLVNSQPLPDGGGQASQGVRHDQSDVHRVAEGTGNRLCRGGMDARGRLSIDTTKVAAEGPLLVIPML